MFKDLLQDKLATVALLLWLGAVFVVGYYALGG